METPYVYNGQEMPTVSCNGFPVIICSDLHLKHPDCDYAGIDSMLEYAERIDARIIVAGDLLDTYIVDIEEAIISQRKRLRRIRDRLLGYVVGNHDSPILHEGLKLLRFYPFVIAVVDGRPWYVEHGHLVGKYGWIFAILDQVDERSWFRDIARLALKTRVLATAGRIYKDPRFKESCIRKAKKVGPAVCIFGHSHEFEIDVNADKGTGLIYLNPGAALGKLSYILYEQGNFRRMP